MAKFVIQPHGRLQEWIADEKGYFHDEGLDYEFLRGTSSESEQLAGQEIAVGYHSGSHFTTVQSLEPFLGKEQIKLRFGGSIRARVDIGIDRDLPAVSVWGLSFQVLEHLGFRKVVDTSFMIAFLFPAGVEAADVEKYMNGMKRAQMDLDLAPEKYRHYYLNEIPDRYKSKVDVRRFSTGERIVFLPYTEDMYTKTQAWIDGHGMFEGQPPAADSGRLRLDRASAPLPKFVIHCGTPSHELRKQKGH